MANIEYGILDIHNENEIVEYEKKLFQDSVSDRDNYYGKKYEIIDNNRLRFNIPYKDQVIYTARESSGIVAAATVNLNHTKKLQLEEAGFKIEAKMRKKNISEMINFYIKNEHEEYTILVSMLCAFILKDLHQKKIEINYTLCPLRLKGVYLSVGFIELDRKKINDSQICLLMARVTAE